MKRSCADLKAMARERLSGKYGIYIGALLVYYLITTALSMLLTLVFPTFTVAALLNGLVSSGALVLFYVTEFIISLILSIFTIGFLKMYLDGSRGYPVIFSDLFYGFRHHPDRAILLSLLLGLITLACLLPGYIVLFAAVYFLSFPALITGIFLVLAGAVLAVVFSIGFSQAFYLLTDYDDLGPVRAMKESWRMMKGHKGRYFYMKLSFLGVLLLTILTCGIALLWVSPYLSMTQTMFYRELDGELDQEEQGVEFDNGYQEPPYHQENPWQN